MGVPRSFDSDDLPEEWLCMSYIRKGHDVLGDDVWIIFGHDGSEIMGSNNRSSVFFFAAENGMKVVQLN